MPRHDAGAEALTPPGVAGAVMSLGIDIDPIDCVDWVDQTGSTNADLLEWVRSLNGVPIAPRLLAAHRQTAGRGRRGKTWHSSPGESLTFSLAWPLSRADFSGLSLAVGAALADALDKTEAPARDDTTRHGELGGRAVLPRIGLKWPNDLWLTDTRLNHGRKLGGVLIETLLHGDGLVAVIGVGINIGAMRMPLQDAATGPAWLREIDAEATPSRVLETLVPALSQALRLFEREGLAAFVASFATRDVLRDRAVRCAAGRGDNVFGTAAGITPTGELLLRAADGRSMRIGSGDVSIRLDEAGGGAAADPAARAASMPAERPC